VFDRRGPSHYDCCNGIIGDDGYQCTEHGAKGILTQQREQGETRVLKRKASADQKDI
jgi:hypothetical protein